VVKDSGPPSGFPLACATLLHAFWCAVLAFYVSTRLTMSVPRSPRLTVVLWVLAVATFLYAFTIHQLWRKRRWALRACWIPVVGWLVFGLLGLVAMLVQGEALSTGTWVVFSIVLVPGILLVPLQWTIRRDRASLPRE